MKRKCSHQFQKHPVLSKLKYNGHLFLFDFHRQAFESHYWVQHRDDGKTTQNCLLSALIQNRKKKKKGRCIKTAAAKVPFKEVSMGNSSLFRQWLNRK